MLKTLIPPSIQDERSLAFGELIERLPALDLEPIRVLNLERQGMDVLRLLAEQFGLPPWGIDGLAEADLRARIRASIPVHKALGTLGALKELARYAGSEILRAITPPSKTFCAPSQTVQERNAWLARMPQLRFYRYRGHGVAGHGAFIGWKTFCGGHRMPLQSDAVSRIGTRPALWDRGIETWLVQVERETITSDRVSVTDREVRQPSLKGRTSFPGFPVRLCASDASARIHMVRLLDPFIENRDQLHLQAAIPGLAPVALVPEAVGTLGTRQGMFTAKSFPGAKGRSCLLQTTSGDRIYERIYLHDRALSLTPKGRTTHLGMGCRLGMPPHNAEITLSVPGIFPIRCTSRFIQGYLKPADTSRWDRCLGALRYGKRLSDRIQVRALAPFSITAGEHLTSGSTTCGTFAAH